jgi:hypothetical protein
MREFFEIILQYSPLFSAAAAVGAVAMSARNAQKIQDVHISINSRMDQLLDATRTAAEAVGAAQERKENERRSMPPNEGQD